MLTMTWALDSDTDRWSLSGTNDNDFEIHGITVVTGGRQWQFPPVLNVGATHRFWTMLPDTPHPDDMSVQYYDPDENLIEE